MSSSVGIELQGHFESVEQQRETSKLGMWTFLMTELLLFSGMFVSALVIRVMHPESVTAVALHLKFWIGATNTVVLIVSSFCMSVAIEASRLGHQRIVVLAMRLTAALGVLFLCLKGYEYYRDYAEHLTPFLSWRPYDLEGDTPSRLFVDLYFIATGLHAIHLTVGIGLMLFMSWLAGQHGYLQRHQNRIEIVGLYWHF
ncbi:MAG: cytochrome oxidase subunit III, partial [Rhodospirillales bacterium]|nr:cytochrome oxidase subunit III [Acetobacter sp.]